MSLANEADSRETIRLLLTDEGDGVATDSDYSNTGAVPDTVEVVEDSPFKTKITTARAAGENALYLWRPSDGEVRKFGADGSVADRTERVRAECFAPSSSAANNLKEDVISITAGYATDNKANTAWVDIWPESEVDSRHETGTPHGDAFVTAVLVRLRRDQSV